MATTFGTAGNDSWTVVKAGTFTLDGLGGTDSLYLGTSQRSDYKITKTADGAVHIDSVSGASAALHATLYNMETLVFNNQRDVLNLATYFGNTDTTAPTVSAISPANQSTAVAVGANIVVTFSETIARGTGSITLKDGTGVVIATYNAATSANLSVSGNTLTINPTQDLANGTFYTVTLAAGSVKDAAGNSLATTNSYTFTTVAQTAFVGTAGNDVFAAPNTTITYDGLAGIDTVSFGKAKEAYTIAPTATGFTVSDGVAIDQLTRVERLVFSDGSKLALDLDGHAGQAAKILGAVFGPLSVTGKPNYVGIGLSYLDGGTSYSDLMQMALDVALAGNNSAKAIVELLFTNVVGRAPSADEAAPYVAMLDSHSTTPAALAVMAADLSLNTDHIALAGLTTTGLAFS